MFERKNGKLLMHFLPHMQKPDGQGNVCFYAPQYRLVFAPPFHHPVYFINFGFLSAQPEPKPVSTVRSENLAAHKADILTLYQKADAVIGAAASAQQEALMRDYEAQLRSLAGTLGIEEIYGGTYDSYRHL